MEGKNVTILYIDDEPNNLVSFKANFHQFYKIYLAGSAAEGLSLLREHKIQVLVTDHKMPVTTGVEFLEVVSKEFPDVVRILLTAYTDIETVIQAINKGQVYRYIMKPFNVVELKLAIDNAAELYKLREENKELIKKLLPPWQANNG